MSEPVSNAEIEDVLSSIRKLVSENNSANRDVEPSRPVVEKLVLTPALRVSDIQDDPEQEPADSRSEDAVEAAELEATPVQDLSELPIMPAPQDPPRRSRLEERIAELEEAVSRSHDDWEPDGSEYDSETSDTLTFEPEDFSGDPDVPEADDETMAESEDDDDLDALSGEPESGADEIDLEMQNDDEAAVDAVDAVEAPEEADPVQAEEQGEAATAADTEDGLYPDLEETILDEEALRELVAALVREELQGHVGERITRNVRRLVRREIQRAMALKDFD